MTPEQEAEWPEGRLDEHGVRWFACDPYPHWFRREDGDVGGTSRIIEKSIYRGDPYWRDEIEEQGGLRPVDGHAWFRVWDDRCSDRGDGMGCGYPEAEHPKQLGPFRTHDFVPSTRFVRDDHPMLPPVGKPDGMPPGDDPRAGRESRRLL